MFTTRELGDMAVSVVVLGFLFSFLPGFLPQGSPWIMNLLCATILSAVAWFLHIGAQKVVAGRYECKAIYFMSPHFIAISIMLTLFLGVMSMGQLAIVVVAVGFIDVSTKYSTRLGYKFMGLTLKETGQSTLAGWIANVGLALGLKVVQPLQPSLFAYFMEMNLWIALFNLIPIPPLDGSKIISWNFTAWLVALVLSIFMVVALPLLGLVESAIFVLIMLIILFIVGQRLVPRPVGGGYAE